MYQRVPRTFALERRDIPGSLLPTKIDELSVSEQQLSEKLRTFSFSFNTCCVCSGDKPCTLLVVKIVGASPVTVTPVAGAETGSDGGVGSCWFSCVSRRFGSCDVADDDDDDDDSVRSIEAVGLAASASSCRFVASVLDT